MNYPLYNLNDTEFEELVGLVCSKILGTGIIIFSQGKDGGRDGKFTGMANNFPSSSSPWCGKFIIQAKHTTKPNSSCTDSDFITILKKELKSIIELKEAKKVEYYLLFTNRKLSGLQDSKIEDFIKSKIILENRIIGLETIQLFLKSYPDVVKLANLNKLLIPLDFYEEDIRDTIICFTDSGYNSKDLMEIKDKFLKIPIKNKNRLNSLSEEYFDNVLKKSYVHFNKIESFLEDPINSEYKEKYENTVLDIQEKISIKRNDFAYFDDVLAYLYDKILDECSDKLLKKRRFIRTFLHFMYATCDIGRKVVDNVTT
ncbi:MAG: hypothetical protein HQ557_06070 [Bacteroidetes bacterium]|nr:hypothetical protein [Bacteroidota bacterium]